MTPEKSYSGSLAARREYRLTLAPVLAGLPSAPRTVGWVTVVLTDVNGVQIYVETVPEGELPRRIAEAVSYAEALDKAVVSR